MVMDKEDVIKAVKEFCADVRRSKDDVLDGLSEILDEAQMLYNKIESQIDMETR
jgi:hypothetical protein